MGGYGGAMRARGFHQLAILQLRDCALHRAFGKTGFISEHTQAGLDRTPALPGGTAGKIKVNEEGGRLLVALRVGGAISSARHYSPRASVGSTGRANACEWSTHREPEPRPFGQQQPTK